MVPPSKWEFQKTAKIKFQLVLRSLSEISVMTKASSEVVLLEDW
jgi:hypothetical protein